MEEGVLPDEKYLASSFLFSLDLFIYCNTIFVSLKKRDLTIRDRWIELRAIAAREYVSRCYMARRYHGVRCGTILMFEAASRQTNFHNSKPPSSKLRTSLTSSIFQACLFHAVAVSLLKYGRSFSSWWCFLASCCHRPRCGNSGHANVTRLFQTFQIPLEWLVQQLDVNGSLYRRY